MKTGPDLELARIHLKKSEYNYDVSQRLEKLKVYDWALNVGFYAVYHCFLGILAKYGYASRNQSCTITALLKLIDDKMLDFDRDLVFQFDTLDVEENMVNPTVRIEREISTYGVDTSIDLEQLKRLNELILKVQKETIRILAE
jgi:uncharacterized protein (UPF0332 family)